MRIFFQDFLEFEGKGEFYVMESRKSWISHIVNLGWTSDHLHNGESSRILELTRFGVTDISELNSSNLRRWNTESDRHCDLIP